MTIIVAGILGHLHYINILLNNLPQYLLFFNFDFFLVDHMMSCELILTNCTLFNPDLRNCLSSGNTPVSLAIALACSSVYHLTTTVATLPHLTTVLSLPQGISYGGVI